LGKNNKQFLSRLIARFTNWDRYDRARSRLIPSNPVLTAIAGKTRSARKGRTLGEKVGDPFDGLLLRYVNFLTGGPTLPTLSCEIQMLRPKEETKLHRHTSSAIYHVFEGVGFTVIDDVRLEWEKGDTFTVPLWRRHFHGNSSHEKNILFVMNDRPVMEALGFYCEESAENR
jgi:gentisate 1,2-dioxygenase